jgi:hypothetical protein
MRLVYYQEKLYLSLTKTESEELYHAKGRAIEICNYFFNIFIRRYNSM